MSRSGSVRLTIANVSHHSDDASDESDEGTIVGRKFHRVHAEMSPHTLKFSETGSFLSVSGARAGPDHVATPTDGIAR